MPFGIHLETASMDDFTQQEISNGDMDHSLGRSDALLIVSHQATPVDDGALDRPTAPRQSLKAGLAVDTTYNVEGVRLVHDLTVITDIIEHTLDPWLPLADGIEDHPRAGSRSEKGFRCDHPHRSGQPSSPSSSA